jgi:hypothetical protein
MSIRHRSSPEALLTDVRGRKAPGLKTAVNVIDLLILRAAG